MKISKIMTRSPGTCSPGDTLAAAAETMRRFDCGMVPVVEGTRVIGTVTDRDIALAALRSGAALDTIPVSDAASKDPAVCSPSDKVEKAISKMKKRRVRRLPVVDHDGVLVGVISIADIAAASKKNKKLRKKLLSALREISAPRPIVLTEIAG
ncbi:MAG: CBS domain-containing protein [Acidobacteriota bacterium]|nr:MAG: CBS domain-containing protein [Acidobacteriota bacterium]